MIVSHQHRFIFVAIPKTGTHSVRQGLRDHLGEGDMEQARLFVEKQFPIPEIARMGHGHISFAEIRPFLGEDVFGDYFKFAFVRNPFDRFVSYCAFATSREGSFARDPKRVMRHFLFAAPPLQHIIFRPQHLFLTDTDGRLLADRLGKVETMQSDYDAICAQIGVATSPLDHANRSRRGDYRDYYDQELIDGVAKIYARDLELFGYDY
ncbi:sulfotransferase family 2 domain-containing protein [Sphingopyxis sp.]|uniref:sulfotransferase family 2 domain-containing protein n=1 Tax=Sphingopyxis sp. TaxID=1908224 RepID=UPI0025FD6F4F|nr:sulfotransferase family 2 domain-containing protein [Sphingopyxis sp.]MBK6412569.1 sulfotransferase family 2 domain-containing protein [Sphingopyxis sp.]